MKEELSNLGYDKENEYFFKINKDLIESRRQQLALDKQKQLENTLKRDYWNKCPKCGHSMAEKNVLGVMIDQCGNCQGTYFDKGELQLLMEAKEQNQFWEWFKKYFHEK